MFKKKREKELINKIDKINYILSKNEILDLMELLGNSKKFLFRKFLSGRTKGIGKGIGFTILTAIIIIILQRIVTLNIPVIGKYISDIVEIVKSKT